MSEQDISMPASFPSAEFHALGLAARPFFPRTLSNEDMQDPLQRRMHFDWAWQAVRYRYRGAAEANDNFKGLLIQDFARADSRFGRCARPHIPCQLSRAICRLSYSRIAPRTPTV